MRSCLPLRMGNNSESASTFDRDTTPLSKKDTIPNTRRATQKLRDVFGQKSKINIVMDFMDTDLEIVIKDKDLILTPANIKSYILQTLLGCEYLHSCWILHRDLKPNNLLLNRNGVLKLGDFGLAKYFGSPGRQYTHQVVTRWYRAPELLYGARNYGTGVDIWACGCILAELLLRNPFLPGETDIEQLTVIFSALGTPTDQTWPGVKDLPDFLEFKPIIATPFSQMFSAAGNDLIQLLELMFKLDPLKRCTATQALKLPYFSNKPGPSIGSELPMPRSVQEVISDVKGDKRAPKRRKIQEGEEAGASIKKILRF